MNNTSIGIRVKPDCIIYSIIKEEGENREIILIDKVNVPIALQVPEQLKFIRSTFLDIIYENNVNRACIRTTESMALKPSIERINIEAVIQELIASSTVEKYFVGQISNISARLGMARENFKKIIDSKECDFIEDWHSFNKEEKESLLASFSALNI
ncbi:MAG: hypothetical protein LUH63_16835 [Parabacteroides sp.]|jgi:hypothetical protein|uniref:hypothetical protein n=1 Tax=Parabacteroides sp. AF17-28 TaxID=2292241 RepID=UPI000F00E8B2|nr:hypothetical protein [Parabacteroides sp. AF17-28]MCD7851226.1 hypothetical protein [Parabacteroides sp.]RHR62708.1 hypothetical protein DWW90_00310 [Parabacteroides sp. AF17-28]